MSIQSNINQGIYIGGLALQNSLEEFAQARRRGKALQAEAEAAQISLDDIENTLKDIEKDIKKPLSEYEKKDMENKIRKNVSTIYDAITAADNPQLSEYINKEKLAPSGYTADMNISARAYRSEQLTRIQKMLKGKKLSLDTSDWGNYVKKIDQQKINKWKVGLEAGKKISPESLKNKQMTDKSIDALELAQGIKRNYNNPYGDINSGYNERGTNAE